MDVRFDLARDEKRRSRGSWSSSGLKQLKQFERYRSSRHQEHCSMMIRHAIPRLSLPRKTFTSAHRTLSTSQDPTITSWIQRLTTSPPRTTTDLIDLERAQQLCRVLPTRSGTNQSLPEWGNSLAKGHHLVYFWPKSENGELGVDGSSTVRLPPLSHTCTVIRMLKI